MVYVFSGQSLVANTGISTSLSYAEKYYGVNQSITQYWTDYFSNNIGISYSQSADKPWLLNSMSVGLSATMNPAVSLSGNFSQSVPSDGYSYTNATGSGNYNLNFSETASGYLSASFTRTMNRQEYSNYSLLKPSVLSYAQNSMNFSTGLTLFNYTSITLDYTGYWYDIAPTSYASAVYTIFLNSIDRFGNSDQKIFTMQGVASGATHSSYGAGLSHQVFTFMRASVNLNVNRTWLSGSLTGSQSFSLSFSFSGWSLTPGVSRSNFLIPDSTGKESLKFNTSYSFSIYRSI